MSDTDWDTFDRLVDLVEQAYVELHCERASRDLTGRGCPPTAGYLADLAGELHERRRYRDKASRLALDLHLGRRGTQVPAVIDLRAAIQTSSNEPL